MLFLSKSIMGFDSRHWAALSLGISIGVVSKAPGYTIYGSYFWTAIVLFSIISACRITYWVALYPTFFTPFKHLPTPPKRWLLTGNTEKLFEAPAGAIARRWAETVPNDGLVRYYGFLCLERVLVTSPKAMGEILVNKSYDFTKTAQLKLSIARVTGKGLGFVEGDEHKAQRKNLMPAFSFRHIKNLYPVFWTKGVEMVKLMEADLAGTDPDKVVEIRDWASRATLDILGSAGMDHDFNALKIPDNELNAQYRKMFAAPSDKLRILGLLGYFIDIQFLFSLPIARNRELREGGKYLRSVTRQVIEKKKQKLERKEPSGVDLISVALNSGGFNEESLISNMMTFLAAGHETTSGALQWTTWALCKHPEVQTRLRKEIRDKLPSISAENPVVPDASAVDSLPYLNAVCNEVFRFYPSVALTPREAIKDNTIHGTFIPKGTIMILSAEATNHSCELWGPDAAEFNPERWMGPGNANTGGAANNYANLTFLHGPRSCIGQNFSKAELLCLVAVLIGRFEIELVDPEQELEMNVGITVSPKDGVLTRMRVVEGW
ncbi:cytochrome P450 [Rhexocercosporidium sp. MPI-PUGE-AT-0058]|nr:cytochrome P450 [Rhexocercosporidium sp. MPI-PUGE-AT-0058]